MNAQYAHGLPQKWAKFSRFFSALGDETRQRILLLFRPNEEICVNDIAAVFKLTRPAVSHHLKVLREANILLSDKRGKEVYYRVNYVYCAYVLGTVGDYVSVQLAASRAAAVGPRGA
jgi:DNA-binding transcriptional ArsR family regulator